MQFTIGLSGVASGGQGGPGSPPTKSYGGKGEPTAPFHFTKIGDRPPRIPFGASPFLQKMSFLVNSLGEDCPPWIFIPCK